MKKALKIGLLIIALILLVVVLKYFNDANSKDIITYKVEHPFYTAIDVKTVATGKLIPEEEIELKPQISGIVDSIFVEEGDVVKKGALIARVRVVPNEQSLANAKSRIATSKLSFKNAEVLYKRNKTLFKDDVISRQDFEKNQLNYNQAKENLLQAQNDYQIIKQGSLGGSAANTNIIAQISGTILEIPVRKGNQVIQSNNFNAGTTIATIANMNAMIFEGKIDESDVAKLQKGKAIKIILGAINDQEFNGVLTFVAPKGVETNGAVQFTIKADVTIPPTVHIKAGYSANAEINLNNKDRVLAIREALLQYNTITQKPYVEVQQADGKFKKTPVQIGLSDGINAEIIDGVDQNDAIKIWNKASDDDNAKRTRRRRR